MASRRRPYTTEAFPTRNDDPTDLLAPPITTPSSTRRRSQPTTPGLTSLARALVASLLLGSLLYLYTSGILRPPGRTRKAALAGHGAVQKVRLADQVVESVKGVVKGHADFDDGRKRGVKREFALPESEGLGWVNVMLGNAGPEPDLSGGMIPAVAPPFAMTRWTPQTRQHYVSMCPYNQTDTKIHAFLGTHQPAIWMGESGPAQIMPGLGEVETEFDKRGMSFKREDEYASANYYTNLLDGGSSGNIRAEMSATSRVGHLRFTFNSRDGAEPYVVVQASRPSVLLSGWNTINRTPDNVTFPTGLVEIDMAKQEVHGWNTERQDHILVGDELPAKGFKGYFVARFSEPFTETGVSYHGQLREGRLRGRGEDLAGYVRFKKSVKAVDVRVGVSFISVEQARRNLDLEIPDGQSLETTSRETRTAWADKLDRLAVTAATPQNLTVLYTSLAHTLVYPYEVHEPTPDGPAYYSGYVDAILPGESYSGYSIWDTYRAETALLLLLAPERVPGMIRSMLQDYREGGWMPMWKNIVETNIMVGTHGDSIVAQAMSAGVEGFDWKEAWEAVRKDAYQPPDRDTELRFDDRDEHTPQEVRAGLTEYMKLGYVAADLHSESGSRTLDYAYDDHAAAIVAELVGASEEAQHLRERSKNYRNLWNEKAGFMEARNSDGAWAGETVGWTEGDHWAYSLYIMHDVPGLITLMGGNKSFVDFLDRHFEGGHNLHTNEPSHHIPYLYAYAGAPHKTQEHVLEIGQNDYNHTAGGLSGNEDCGQMSAWYIFSALGFYPVDPASGTYVIGTPFFDEMTVHLPGASRPLRVVARGASDGSKYIKSLTIDGKPHDSVFLSHEHIKDGAELVFEMEATPQVWGI